MYQPLERLPRETISLCWDASPPVDAVGSLVLPASTSSRINRRRVGTSIHAKTLKACTPFVSYIFCFFGDVSFSEYFCVIAVFSLYEEFLVRSFLPGGVSLPYMTTGWILDTSLCDICNISNKNSSIIPFHHTIILLQHRRWQG